MAEYASTFASIFTDMDGPSTSNFYGDSSNPETAVNELKYLDLVHTDTSCSTTPASSSESLMDPMPNSMAAYDPSSVVNNYFGPSGAKPAEFLEHEGSSDVPVSVDQTDWEKYYYKVKDPHADLIDKTIRDLSDFRERQKNVDCLLEEELLTVSQAEQIMKEKEQSKKDIENFLAANRKRTMFACFICSKAFFDEDLMRTHITDNHISRNEKYIHKCPKCSQRFKRRQHLNRHINHQHKVDGFSCKICKAKYSTPTSLIVHLSRDHGVDDNGVPLNKKFKCSCCGEKFASDTERKRHQSYCIRRLEIAEKRAEQRETLKAMQPSSAVSSPAASVYSPSSRPKLDKSCSICGLLCSSIQKRNNHIKSKHPEATEEHFKRTYVKVESPQLPYGCLECGKRFATHASLSTHKKRVHENQNKFECETCAKRYPLASELRKHIRRVHGNQEDDSLLKKLTTGAHTRIEESFEF